MMRLIRPIGRISLNVANGGNCKTPGSAGDHAGISCYDIHGIMNEHKMMENPGCDSDCCVLCGQDARVPGKAGCFAITSNGRKLL